MTEYQTQIENQIRRLRDSNVRQNDENNSLDSEVSVKESKNYENTLFKINDFENQLSESDFNTLNKSLTKAVERIDNNQSDS